MWKRGSNLIGQVSPWPTICSYRKSKKKVNKWKQTNEQTQQQQQKAKQHVQLSHKKELSFFETHILQMEEPAESKRKVTGFSKAAYF